MLHFGFLADSNIATHMNGRCSCCKWEPLGYMHIYTSIQYAQPLVLVHSKRDSQKCLGIYSDTMNIFLSDEFNTSFFYKERNNVHTKRRFVSNISVNGRSKPQLFLLLFGEYGFCSPAI